MACDQGRNDQRVSGRRTDSWKSDAPSSCKRLSASRSRNSTDASGLENENNCVSAPATTAGANKGGGRTVEIVRTSPETLDALESPRVRAVLVDVVAQMRQHSSQDLGAKVRPDGRSPDTDVPLSGPGSDVDKEDEADDKLEPTREEGEERVVGWGDGFEEEERCVVRKRRSLCCRRAVHGLELAEGVSGGC